MESCIYNVVNWVVEESVQVWSLMDALVLTVLGVAAVALIATLVIRKRRADSMGRDYAIPANLLEVYSDLTNDLTRNEQLMRKLEEAVQGIRNVNGEIYELAAQALTELEQGKTTSAVRFYQQRVKDADNDDLQADSHLNVAVLVYKDDPELAMSSLQEAVEIDPNSLFGWNQLGILYFDLDQLDDASSALQKAIEIQESEFTFDRLACVYEAQEQFDDAIVFFKKALAKTEESGDKARMAVQYGNIGNVYEIMGETDKAIEYLKKSLQIELQLDRQEGVASDYGNLGICYQAKGELDQAHQYYAKSLAINERLQRKSEIVIQLGNLGIVCESQGNMKAAVVHWTQARDLHAALGDEEAASNMQDWIDQAKS